MSTILILLRLALAAVLAVAACAKLADRAGARAAAGAFGVPPRLTGVVAVGLPLVELAIAGALVPAVTAPWAAVAAVALLGVFAAAIAAALRRGEAPDCHCFGQLHSAPAGRGTLARNAILAALAAGVAVDGLAGGAPSVGDLTAPTLAVLGGGLLLASVLGAGAWFGLELLRQNGRMLLRLEAMEELLRAGGGEAALAAPVESLEGERFTLAQALDPHRSTLLVFADPACGPCTALLPEVAAWQADPALGVDVLLLSRGGPEDHRAHVAEHGIARLLLDRDGAVAEAFGVAGTPSGVLVGSDGRRLSEPAGGAEAIRALLRAPAGPGAPFDRSDDTHGEEASFDVPGLDGPVRSEDLRGEPALLLFWNPGCGFCERMLDDLRALDRAADGPRLVVISTDDVDANRALGLRAPVALDAEFTVGQALGAGGTPSAVLLDAEGRVAAPVAQGAEAVLALAARPPRLVVVRS